MGISDYKPPNLLKLDTPLQDALKHMWHSQPRSAKKLALLFNALLAKNDSNKKRVELIITSE